MRIQDVIRRSCYVAAVALLCFVPGTFAQSRIASPMSAAAVTRSAGVFMYSPIDWNKNNKNNKKTAAPEGGNAGLYLLLAGFSCCAAIALRSRRPAGSA
jgi:hypothetical protein